MNQSQIITIFSFLLSIFITITTIPFVREYCLNANIVDLQDHRKQHRSPIVRLGGIAIFISFITTIFINLLIKIFFPQINYEANYLYSILIGSSIFFLIGLTDDLISLSPYIRLVMQFISASLVWIMGVKINFINLFWFHNIEVPIVISYLFSVFWIVAITNAINWFDGLDGLASGIMFIFMIGLYQRCYNNNDLFLIIITSTIAGACLGFLKYNFYPANIIMGDGGSNFLGFILGTISLYSCRINDDIFSLNFAIFIVSIPLIDMIYVIYKRLINKRSPFYPDRIHLHHRLLKAGYSHKNTVYIIYFIGLSLLFLQQILF